MYVWKFKIVGGGITTNPVVTLLKLGSNQTRIGEDGFVEYFGSAESFVRLPFDLNWLKPSGSQPSNQDTFISDSIGVGRSLNKYNAGEFRQAGFITELPEEIDTSHVLVLRFRYFTNNVNSGNILTRVVWGYNLDILDDPEQPGPLPSPSLSSVFPTTGAAPTSAAGDIGEILKTITISSGTNNRMMTIDYDLDICQLVPGRIGGSKTGDLLWVTFVEDGYGRSYPAIIVNVSADGIQVKCPILFDSRIILFQPNYYCQYTLDLSTFEPLYKASTCLQLPNCIIRIILTFAWDFIWTSDVIYERKTF